MQLRQMVCLPCRISRGCTLHRAYLSLLRPPVLAWAIRLSSEGNALLRYAMARNFVQCDLHAGMRCMEPRRSLIGHHCPPRQRAMMRLCSSRREGSATARRVEASERKPGEPRGQDATANGASGDASSPKCARVSTSKAQYVRYILGTRMRVDECGRQPRRALQIRQTKQFTLASVPPGTSGATG